MTVYNIFQPKPGTSRNEALQAGHGSGCAFATFVPLKRAVSRNGCQEKCQRWWPQKFTWRKKKVGPTIHEKTSHSFMDWIIHLNRIWLVEMDFSNWIGASLNFTSDIQNTHKRKWAKNAKIRKHQYALPMYIFTCILNILYTYAYCVYMYMWCSFLYPLHIHVDRFPSLDKVSQHSCQVCGKSQNHFQVSCEMQSCHSLQLSFLQGGLAPPVINASWKTKPH